MVVEPNVGLEITKGVGKVVVQELHGILELVSCDHVGDNICCWNIGRYRFSMRWWWARRMTGRCTRWERWLPGSGGGLKVLNWNLHSFQLLEIIQVLDSISWVRCASGNVLTL